MDNRTKTKADSKVRKVSVRLSKGEKEALYKLAFAKDVSISDVIREYMHKDSMFNKLYDPDVH